MIGAIRHRGPDDVGYFVSPDVGIVHARLSIIDLEHGRQPIANEDASVQIAMNGEIFNHIELRRDLIARGHSFATRSDVEVAVHLYEDRGVDFLHALNGQFALVLWDARTRQLTLARDRVGIRPLFYTVVAGRLLFASEIKALLTVPEVPRRLNARALAETFTFWSPLEPSTMFEGIFAVPAGHVMTVKVGSGRVSTQRYWDWTFPERLSTVERPVAEYEEELREILDDAVRLQLRADVSVGAYASGGLDSAVVVALAARHTAAPLRTFSLAFPSPDHDERAFQSALVRHHRTDHTELLCTDDDIAGAFARAIWHAEAPILRTAPTPLLLLSAAVRRAGLKVVLTGEGADEVFGGYDLFKEARIRRFWSRAPHSASRPQLLRRLYPYLSAQPTAARAYPAGFFGRGLDDPSDVFFGHRPRWSTTRRAWRFFGEALRDELRGWEPCDALEATLPAGFSRWDPLDRDQYIETQTLLTGYLLSAQGDRMAMANAVETRFPFLDHRLMEFASRLPSRYRIMGLREKYLVRRALGPLVPEAIRRRPKQPYRAPDSPCFFPAGRPWDYVRDLLHPDRIRESGYFDPSATTRLYEKCRRGEAVGAGDNMAFVGVLSTMLLDEMFFRGRAPDVPLW